MYDGYRIVLKDCTVEPRYNVPHWENEKSTLYQSVPYIEVLYKSNRNDTSTQHHGLEGADPLDRVR